MSSTTFDRAKSKLVELGAVTCDNPGVSGALYKAVEGWTALPAENDTQDEDADQDDNIQDDAEDAEWNRLLGKQSDAEA